MPAGSFRFAPVCKGQGLIDWRAAAKPAASLQGRMAPPGLSGREEAEGLGHSPVTLFRCIY